MHTAELPPWLSDAAAGLASGDIDAWLDAFAEDAVHEFPFAAPGTPRRIEGKAAIRAFLTGVTGRLRFSSLSDVRVHTTDDGAVIEAAGHHQDTVTGDLFDLRYVWIVTWHDDRVTLLRDYMSPRWPRGEQK